MKKFAPIVAIAMLGMMFTSCKKEYTCQCTVNGTTTDVWTQKLKKSDAEAACTAANVVATCKLK